MTTATAAGGAKFVIDLPGAPGSDTLPQRTLTEELFTREPGRTR